MGTKDRIVKARVDEELHSWLTAQARRKRLTLSDLLRLFLVERMEAERDGPKSPQEDRECLPPALSTGKP